MLSVKIYEEKLIAVLQPDGKLSASDFKAATNAIDPLIEKSGKFNGLIIRTQKPPALPGDYYLHKILPRMGVVRSLKFTFAVC